MRFKADEIASVLQAEIEQYESQIDVREVGRVLEVGDGIARVYGLSGVMAGEMVEFPSGVNGVGLQPRRKLRRRHHPRRLPGDQGRGRGQEHRPAAERAGGRRGDRPRGRSAGQPARRQRARSSPPSGGRSKRLRPAWPNGSRFAKPLQTGIKAIDAMTPIGRGQRELIIGDRKTGKTAIAIDTIINQKNSGVKCFYVAIGQQDSKIAGVIEALRKHGAMDYTTVIVSGASDARSVAVLSLRTPARRWRSISCGRAAMR